MIKLSHFKPAIVLGLLTTIVSAALIVTASLLPDMSHVLTDKLREACVQLMGEGEFELAEDAPDAVNKLIRKDDGQIAFEITTGGFKPPDGITVLVAMNSDGSVRGVIPVAIKDTPSYGNRVREPAFLEQFADADSDSEFDGITGATYSSRGVIEAVEIALAVWEEYYCE
jgi:Na+-translocating ferredoxin:NAD+ oxidoreductase RnfG subunit